MSGHRINKCSGLAQENGDYGKNSFTSFVDVRRKATPQGRDLEETRPKGQLVCESEGHLRPGGQEVCGQGVEKAAK